MIEVLWNIWVGSLLVLAIILTLTLMFVGPVWILNWLKQWAATDQPVVSDPGTIPRRRPAEIDPELQQQMEKIALNAMVNELNKQFDK